MVVMTAKHDLHKIANTPGYGTGRAVIERARAESECLALLPRPHDLPVFVAKRARDVREGLPIMDTGYSNEDDADWCIVAMHGTEADAVGHDAMDDAKVIAAILNAYGLGLIVPRMLSDQKEGEQKPCGGDYHEGLEEGWKAGAQQERRIWEQAVTLSLGTIPEGLRNALAQVRAGLEGE